MPKIENEFEKFTHTNTETVIKDFLTAGSTSAMITILEAPLDRVKVMLQVQRADPKISKEKSYKGMFDALIRIPREEGFFSFWRGTQAKIIKAFPNSAFNFTFNGMCYRMLVEGVDRNNNFWAYFYGNLAAGGLAGATSTSILYPLEFSATRTGADIGGKKFTGIIDCMVKTLKADGVPGLYRGFITSVQGIIIYRSAYFGLYDTAKYTLTDPDNVSFFVAFLIATSTTTTAALLAYPFDTVRRRMMMQSGLTDKEIIYKSTLECWRHIIKNEGYLGFYKGGFSNSIAGVGSALVLVSFDKAKQLRVNK
ncbi:unnamed protein product [Psylliodes chrysocephalus]|uniref:ADP/ATP translocase n=1 Tax=Psylliodes chrysocephalus TaxID=3402493 RepID=A0A9P0CGI4_9CUCU|nr:unnamed protein product [Psylliodes chrysocephala]